MRGFLGAREYHIVDNPIATVTIVSPNIRALAQHGHGSSGLHCAAYHVVPRARKSLRCVLADAVRHVKPSDLERCCERRKLSAAGRAASTASTATILMGFAVQ